MVSHEYTGHIHVESLFVQRMNTSAPGKLFLTGEYAVLEGAPALVMPVPQRAIVSSACSDRWIIRSDVEVALPMQEIPLAKAVDDELHRRGLPVSVPCLLYTSPSPRDS